MSAYFTYLKEMIIAFFSNLGRWFVDRYAVPWAVVPAEFDYYNSLLAN